MFVTLLVHGCDSRLCRNMLVHVSMSCVCKQSGWLNPLQVSAVKGTEIKRNPSAPYMTSTMLSDAANRLGSKVSHTMSNAQALFEGDNIVGDGMRPFRTCGF